MPAQNPRNAGRKAHLTFSADCSIAGTIRLQIEAATITPAANPVSARCIPVLRSFFRKSTHADPKAVPKNGIRSPQTTVFMPVSPTLSFDSRSRSTVRRRRACIAAQSPTRRPLRSWYSPTGTWQARTQKAPVPSSACRCRIW